MNKQKEKLACLQLFQNMAPVLCSSRACETPFRAYRLPPELWDTTLLEKCLIVQKVSLTKFSDYYSWIEYSYDSQFSNFMQAFSLQSLAFCCQFNIIDIYKELKDKSQIEPVCHFSLFGICFLVYAVFGLCGYLVCGSEVKDNVLTTSNFHGQAIFIFGTTAVALTNMAKYPLLALPLRSVLNDLCNFESFIDSKSKTVLEMLILNSLV